MKNSRYQHICSGMNIIIENESRKYMNCCDHDSGEKEEGRIQIKDGVIDEIRKGDHEFFVTGRPGNSD